MRLLIICISVLHPRHKLAYFRNAGWEEMWVEGAKTLVKTVFNRKYKSYLPPVARADSSTFTVSLENYWIYFYSFAIIEKEIRQDYSF